mmetsp:Transcript_11686/g.26161  ORF Transcript_11686/g.26161 Transcript_11686/m.26161 type:complete len:121 (+) Transcript_11686:406-768(+)
MGAITGYLIGTRKQSRSSCCCAIGSIGRMDVDCAEVAVPRHHQDNGKDETGQAKSKGGAVCQTAVVVLVVVTDCEMIRQQRAVDPYLHHDGATLLPVAPCWLEERQNSKSSRHQSAAYHE